MKNENSKSLFELHIYRYFVQLTKKNISDVEKQTDTSI